MKACCCAIVFCILLLERGGGGVMGFSPSSPTVVGGISFRVQQQQQQTITEAQSSATRRFASSNLKASVTSKEGETTKSRGINGSPETEDNNNKSSSSIGRLVLLVPQQEDENSVRRSKFGSSSPVPNPTFSEAAQHVAEKAFYFANGRLDYDVVSLSGDSQEEDALMEQLTSQADVLIALGLQTDQELEFASRVFEARRVHQGATNSNRLCHFALDCARDLPALVGPYDPLGPSLSSKLMPWSLDATGRRMYEEMTDLFDRWTSDDICYGIMIFLNQFGPAYNDVDWVKHRTDATWEKGPVQNAQEFYDMITECGDCVLPVLQNPKTRECMNQLTQLDPRDQATSYRTLVSYEDDLLTDMSLCIFTKKNIFNCDAQIPVLPQVTPITSWRGNALTESDAKALLVGHLDDEDAPWGNLGLPISWKVACGANVAYDQFPSQNQIFYHAAKGRDMWYDPVFRVETLDGRHVWCKRHYKVRPQKVPGTFRFSVLDNGVTSDEFWTIVGAADDLSWIVFHYAGAAKAVGLQYLGGLLCTPDGSMPNDSQLPEIWDCMRNAGIQPWELYMVDNRLDAPGLISAGPPPLDFYRSGVLERKAADRAKSEQ